MCTCGCKDKVAIVVRFSVGLLGVIVLMWGGRISMLWRSDLSGYMTGLYVKCLECLWTCWQEGSAVSVF